jgi:hypothetical protein
MAKERPDIERFFQIVAKINKGLQPTKEEFKYYYTTIPDIDEGLIQTYLEEQRKASSDPNYSVDPQILRDGLTESIRMMQTEPAMKEMTAKLVQDRESAELSDKLAQGINLILGGTDIANSINQIQEGKKGARKPRPARPAIPQKSVLLQQALRQAQEGTMDAGRALLPVQAQIQDQYQNDIANAKTASTGQAGNFGAYAQLAADRRNRAALQMAPIQDDIRAREQARYDNLLGMDINENQQMFNNQNDLYGQDLYQYNQEQRNYGALQSQGRENLRNSLYSFGGNLAPNIANYYTQRKYNQLKNQAAAAGLNPDNIVKVRQNLDGYVSPQYNVDPMTVFDAFNKYSPENR